MKNSFCAAVIAVILVGCGAYSTRPDMMASPEYRNRQELQESLFKEDAKVLSGEDIEKILNSRVAMPARARLAILRFGMRKDWSYWSEEFARMDETIGRNFIGRLKGSPRLYDVAILPSMLVPKEMTVPYLREAAARFQANLLLVYRTASQTYSKQNVFTKDETRAYCTVEALLLDVRTGIVVFSSVVNENYSAKKESQDMSLYETTQKAEQAAVGKALEKIADELVGFLNGIPVD
jgi:hypothetical protein